MRRREFIAGGSKRPRTLGPARARAVFGRRQVPRPVNPRWLACRGTGHATTTLLTSSVNPATVGQAVTFTATVNATTGTVTFKDGNTVLTTIPLSEGTARFTTSTLMQGTHRITAVYNGNSTYAGSTSAVLSQVINRR